MNEKFHYLCHHSFIFIPWIVLAPRRSKGCKPQRRATGANACPTPLSWLTAQVAPGGRFLGDCSICSINSWSSWGIYEMCGCFNDVCICWRFFPHPFFQVSHWGWLMAVCNTPSCRLQSMIGEKSQNSLLNIWAMWNIIYQWDAMITLQRDERKTGNSLQ